MILFFISKTSAKSYFQRAPVATCCWSVSNIISYTSWLASACLPVDHLNAPRPSRCKSLSFAFRRLHHRVLISVPAPFLGAYRESTTTICLLFSHPASSFPQFVLKTFHHAIAALGIIAPHCVEFFLNAIFPPLNPNRVESEASPLLFRREGRYPSPLHHHQTVCFLSFSSPVQEFSSISAQTLFICSRFFFATSRLCAVRSSRAARRHLLTWVLASLHIPMDFQRNPRAWHASRAFMSSSQPGEEKLFVSILKCWGMLSSGLECGAYRLGLRDGDGDAWWVDSVIEWCGSR